MSATLTAELRALSPAQKLEVIEALWESLDEPVELLTPASHLDELKRRVTVHRDGGPTGTPWPEVRARALASVS